MIHAEVLADSINPFKERVITVLFNIPTCVLAQFNTHKMLASNTSSQRAIPTAKIAQAVYENPYIPQFRANQKGMQGGEVIDDPSIEKLYRALVNLNAGIAEDMSARGVHKQVVNRLMVMASYSEVVASGSAAAWANFLYQRTHWIKADADYAIQPSAEAIRLAMKASKPQFKNYGEWHLPFVGPDEVDDGFNLRVKSAARCARTSYGNHLKENSFENDLELHNRLSASDPPHMSPFEHQMFVSDEGPKHGKFGQYWRTYRSTFPNEYFTDLDFMLSF
jgi:thymidylate synthase ThyX